MKKVKAIVTFKYDFTDTITRMNDERRADGEADMTEAEIIEAIKDDLQDFDFRDTCDGQLPLDVCIEGDDAGNIHFDFTVSAVDAENIISAINNEASRSLVTIQEFMVEAAETGESREEEIAGCRRQHDYMLGLIEKIKNGNNGD